MDFGVTLATHGVVTRDADGDAYIARVPVEDMRPVEMAVRCEELGYHSVWFSDHVVTERVTEGMVHVANASGKRAYPDRPNMLDIVSTIGAISSRTTALRFSPSVWIAPYRHPLTTAHQFATLDVLSNGRVILGVGAGWEKGEFDALGVSHVERGAICDECLQVIDIAWREDWIDFDGRYFQIHDVSLDPKPVQRPRPPLWYGGVTPAGARRAARYCEALYPIFLDAATDPAELDHLREAALREGERVGRDLSGFRLGAFASARVTDDDDPRTLSGRPEQVLEKLARFAQYGYSHVTLHFDCPSGTVDELFEQVERFGAEVLPEARKLEAAALS